MPNASGAAFLRPPIDPPVMVLQALELRHRREKKWRCPIKIVGNPELRRSVDRLRNPVAGYQLVKLLVR